MSLEIVTGDPRASTVPRLTAADIKNAIAHAQQLETAVVQRSSSRHNPAADRVDYAVVRRLHEQVRAELEELLREKGEVSAEYHRGEGERVATLHVNDWVDAQRRRGTDISDDDESALLDAVLDEVTGLGRLQPLLNDPTIENITIKGHRGVRIEYRDGGGIEYGRPVADSDEHLVALIQNLARQGAAIGSTERSLSSAEPMLDMQTPDGSRLTTVIEITDMPVVTIRRHSDVVADLHELTGPKWNMLDPVLADFLAAVARTDDNVMIGGKGGSGKTTVLRAIGQEIPKDEWFVVMEESRELGFHTTSHPWCISMETRKGHGDTGPDGKPAGSIGLAKMFPITQRLNTQRVIVGEVRDEEIIAALQAMSTTGGSYCTIHARSVDLVFERVVELALANSNENSVERAYRQVAGAIDYIVYVDIVKIGGVKYRHISHVLEIEGVADGQVRTTTVFGPDASGRAVPLHKPSKRHLDTLLDVGYDPAPLDDYRGTGRWQRPFDRKSLRLDAMAKAGKR